MLAAVLSPFHEDRAGREVTLGAVHLVSIGVAGHDADPLAFDLCERLHGEIAVRASDEHQPILEVGLREDQLRFALWRPPRCRRAVELASLDTRQPLIDRHNG